MAETGPPTISIEEVMREFFIDMKKELNIRRISDVLYAKGLIDYNLKKKVDRETNQDVDANELLLDHLIRNGTLETFKRFCDVLEETSESHLLPHHRAWSNKLKQKLIKYTTFSSDLTPQSSQDELLSTSLKLRESSSMMESSQGLPSSSSPVSRGESTQTMSTMDERSKRIKEIVDKYRNGEELFLPSNPDLEDELDDIMGNLRVNLLSVDPRVISKLQAIVQMKYRRYVHGVRPVQLPPVPDTGDGLYKFIAEKSTPYEIFLVHHAVEVLKNEDLKKNLLEYESKLAKYLEEMLTSCKRKRVTLPLRKDHTHMAVVISKEQVLLSLVLEMKEYFSKYLQLDETLFEGFVEGSIMLFFSIFRADAAQLSSKVLSNLSELKKMFGMTHLIVFGYFACDLEKATIEHFNLPATCQYDHELKPKISSYTQAAHDLVQHRDTGMAWFREADDLDKAFKRVAAAKIGGVLGVVGGGLLLGGVTAPAGIALLVGAALVVGGGITVVVATIGDVVKNRRALKRANEWIRQGSELCRKLIRRHQEYHEELKDMMERYGASEEEILEITIGPNQERNNLEIDVDEFQKADNQALLAITEWKKALEMGAEALATAFVAGTRVAGVTRGVVGGVEAGAKAGVTVATKHAGGVFSNLPAMFLVVNLAPLGSTTAFVVGTRVAGVIRGVVGGVETGAEAGPGATVAWVAVQAAGVVIGLSAVFMVVDLARIGKTAYDLNKNKKGTELARKLRQAADDLEAETAQLRPLANFANDI